MTTEFGEAGKVNRFTLYSPPDETIMRMASRLLPPGAVPEAILLLSSGGLEIEINPDETPRQALERWKRS